MSAQKQSKERHYGKGSRGCTRCGTKQGLVRRYGINLCRQCFREVAVKMGFKKFR